MTPHHHPHPRPVGDEESWSDDEIDGILASTDDALRSSLAQILAPPADFETRVGPGAAAGLMNRSIVGTLGDLLLVGWQTVRFLAVDPPSPDDHMPDADPYDHREEDRP